MRYEEVVKYRQSQVLVVRSVNLLYLYIASRFHIQYGIQRLKKQPYKKEAQKHKHLNKVPRPKHSNVSLKT